MQTRTESAIESSINIASGFLISYCVWMLIGYFHLFGIATTPSQGFVIVCIFTITSWLRSYFWRRFFANDVHKYVHKLITER